MLPYLILLENKFHFSCNCQIIIINVIIININLYKTNNNFYSKSFKNNFKILCILQREVVAYDDPRIPLFTTDLDKLEGKPLPVLPTSKLIFSADVCKIEV